VYELTKWGAELEPVITHLGRWGSRSPLLPRNAHSSIDSLLLSLRSMFAPDAARDFNATITLRVDERPFHIEVSDGTFQLGGGESNTSTVVLETDRDTLAEMLYHGRTLKNAMHAGAATVTGPTTVAARFLQLFPQPQPADLD
jgi:Alkyl sulfatase C-terminal